MSRRRKLILGILGLLTVCCVGLFAFAMIDRGVREIGLAPTYTPVPTATESPTPTETLPPEDTPTPGPTNTPRPTETPAPTDTAEPTNTPIPTETPEATPEPIVLTGIGDSVVDIDKGPQAALVHIAGNAAGSHFAVANYDANGEQIDLLVNTVETYDGIRPLDFRNGEHTARFEVTATGEWTIEVLPLTSIERVDVPGEMNGTGDYVFALNGTPDTAHIVGNSAGRHFSVIGYGDFADLMVNTVDPYDGTVLIEPETLVIEVTATGDWTITFE